MNPEHTQESWQVEARGKVFETNFAEMTGWIDQGVLLRQDKVRKGNLRWIEAGKVPSLVAVFNAKESGEPLPAPVITLTKLSPTSIPGNAGSNPDNFAPERSADAVAAVPAENVCSVHPDLPAAFVCTICSSHFCKGCPNSYGGTVKICPYCGAMCDPLRKKESATFRPVSRAAYSGDGFGFADLGAAFAYPFRFRASLILGAIMFAFFSIGQSAFAFGGIFMLSAAIISAMLANTLTFGILANTVENIAQGKLDLNFMPAFDDFSIWDDVVQPFFLMIAVYISSFGPLAIVTIVAFFMIAGSVPKVGPGMSGPRSDAARIAKPDLPYAVNAVEQSQRVKELLKKTGEDQQRRIDALDDREIQPDVTRDPLAAKDPGEIDFEQMNRMIQEQRKAQLEATIGKAPDTIAKERGDFINKIVGYGAVFLILGGICLLWGLFYYPAACAVAGYTRSFGATLNPLVGLDTIRRLGFDYVKILLMCVVLALISGVITGMLSMIFAPFDMPGVGNIPAKGVGSLFAFYFSVVFALVLGYAFYKAADRLKLPGA